MPSLCLSLPLWVDEIKVPRWPGYQIHWICCMNKRTAKGKLTQKKYLFWGKTRQTHVKMSQSGSFYF
jgi:hypothetical protein